METLPEPSARSQNGQKISNPFLKLNTPLDPESTFKIPSQFQLNIDILNLPKSKKMTESAFEKTYQSITEC